MTKENIKVKSTPVEATPEMKGDSVVTVKIQKPQHKGAAPKDAKKPGQKVPVKNAAKAQGSKKSGQNLSNRRVLNVVELGESNPAVGAKSHGKAIDGMVKTAPAAADVKPKDTVKAPAKSAAESAESLEPKVKKNAKKKNQKMAIIIAAVVLAVGAVAGTVIWMFRQNNREMCTVSFESNGGSKVESVEVVCGGKISEPDEPEKDGFEFREWAYRGKKFDFGNTSVDDDMILVAKWDASDETEIVTISFDAAGGSEVDGLEIKAGTATMAPADPTRDGYTFDGWYLNGEKFDFSEPIDEDIVLVAHWSGATQGPANNSQPNPGASNNDGSSNNSVSQPAPSEPSSGNSGNTSSGGTSGDKNEGNQGGTGENPGDGGDDGDDTTSGGDNNSNVPNPDDNEG